MNERLNTATAAKCGAVAGCLYGLFAVVRAGTLLAAGSEYLDTEFEQLARAIGGLIGCAVIGALMCAATAALINMVSRAR